MPLLRHGEKIERAVFGTDGRRGLTAGATQTTVWDAVTGQPAGPPLKAVTAADSPTLSPDGTRLLSYNQEGNARVWDVATGEALSPPLRLGSQVTHGVFSPDSRFVLTCTQDATARLWDCADRFAGESAPESPGGGATGRVQPGPPRAWSPPAGTTRPACGTCPPRSRRSRT